MHFPSRGGASGHPRAERSAVASAAWLRTSSTSTRPRRGTGTKASSGHRTGIASTRHSEITTRGSSRPRASRPRSTSSTSGVAVDGRRLRRHRPQRAARTVPRGSNVDDASGFVHTIPVVGTRGRLRRRDNCRGVRAARPDVGRARHRQRCATRLKCAAHHRPATVRRQPGQAGSSRPQTWSRGQLPR